MLPGPNMYPDLLWLFLKGGTCPWMKTSSKQAAQLPFQPGGAMEGAAQVPLVILGEYGDLAPVGVGVEIPFARLPVDAAGTYGSRRSGPPDGFP